jgi:hypothetical protein
MSVDAWKDQLTLEERAALTSGSFVGMSPDHDTVEKMAATWASRHGGTP